MATQSLYLNQRSHAASDPIRNFRFLVKFIPPDDGFSKSVKFSPTLGFMAVSGIAMTTEAIPYREGGFNTTVHYLPGQQTFSPVTLQRGVTLGSSQHWNWFKQLFDPGWGSTYTKGDTGGEGSLTGNFRCTVAISVLGHPQPMVTDRDPQFNDPVLHKFYLLNSWITNISYADLNAADNAVFVEQITLVHEGLSMKWSKGFKPTAPSWQGQSTPWNEPKVSAGPA